MAASFPAPGAAAVSAPSPTEPPEARRREHEWRWVEPEEQLASIFSFSYLPASELQSPEVCDSLAGLVSRFVKDNASLPQGSQGAAAHLPRMDPGDVRTLSAAADILQSSRVTWYPDFGCALLALAADERWSNEDGGGAAGSDDLALTLVGLDDWSFRVHNSPGGRMQHTAVSNGHAVLPCGYVEANKYGALQRAIGKLRAQRLQKRKEEGKKVFQRTPAFMKAVVSDALETVSGMEDEGEAGQEEGEEVIKSLPRGGFTDVGPHTGGDSVRDTCWPLIRSALQVLLERGGSEASDCGRPRALVFRTALAHLELWLLRRQLQHLAPATATPTALTVLMDMLRSAASKAAALADDGYDTGAFERACAAAKQYIQAAAAQRALAAAQRLTVPEAGSPAMTGTVTVPTGLLPPPLAPSAAGEGLAAARQRAERNLGSLPLLTPGCSFSYMLELLRQPDWAQPGNDVAAQLALRSVERELFRRAADGLSTSPANRLSGAEVEALERVVDAYRGLLHAYLATPAACAAMRVELQSREVLVVWVAYCLTHAAAWREHPAVRCYGVLGPHHDLRHLVLSDRAAVDAALAVAAYLQQHAGEGGRVLFSLRDGGAATMELAQEFAAGCPRLSAMLVNEQADAEERQKRHWQEVQRKKQLVAEKRALVQQLSSNVQHYSNQLSYTTYGTPQYWAVHTSLSNSSSALDAAQRELQAAEKAPSPVLQPLPRDPNAARRWLFFLHMPPLLRRLSRASFLAQQQLLPRPCSAEVASAITAKEPAASLVQYYNANRGVKQYIEQPKQTVDGADGAVKLYSMHSGPPEPKSVGPSHVDHYSSAEDGVYWPDPLAPCMAWAGTGVAAEQGQGFPRPFFNPFAPLPAELVELAFTERLPAGDAERLQWAMHVRESADATPADRGNLVIAQQDLRPSWLSKPAFLKFGAMRSYPLQQLRQLCAALHDRVLPLAQPAVQLLIRQLLFHIGALSDTLPPALRWRAGWEREHDVLATLHSELSGLAEELAQASAQHDTVMLLGQVVAYLSDWHAPCRAVARRFAGLTRAAAEELRPQLDAAAAAGDDDLVSKLLAQQVKLRTIALLCFGAGPLGQAPPAAVQPASAASSAPVQADDAAMMVELIVLINHGRVFLADEQLLQEMEGLQARAHNVMAARVDFLSRAAAERPQLLTAAVARVLQSTPAQLAWQQLRGSKVAGTALGSWEAVDGSGRLYSINVLDGTVLFDGCPPSRLPKGITEHPLYRRTFGSYNFEVAFKGGGGGAAGVMETMRAIGGRRYEFCHNEASGELRVTEVDVEAGGVRLELLDVGTDSGCGQWGVELPARLRELHSHWLCRERNAIILRPPNFQLHDTHYIIQCAAATGTSHPTTTAPGPATAAAGGGGHRQGYTCWRVPRHLAAAAAVHWTKLLSERRAEITDRLVLLRGSTTYDRILAKFEDVRYIHAYMTTGSLPSGAETLLFEFPRYGLEFELRDGQLVSRNYTGYRLMRCQQLASVAAGREEVVYTLPEFQQYLVLERAQAKGAEAPVGAARADLLVLVPAGKVVSGAYGGARRPGGHGSGDTGLVWVGVSVASGAELQAHCYEVHGRFGHLTAASDLARLQLAALYAATGTSLPEPASSATGGQMAMRLLRQSWRDQPLTAAELEQLGSIGALGGHLAPALRLLAWELRASAARLVHLHAAAAGRVEETPAALLPAAAGGRSGGGGGGGAPALDDDAAAAYWLEVGAARGPGGWWRGNARQQLTISEERRCGGLARESRPEAPDWVRQGRYTQVKPGEPFPVPAGVIKETEDLLCGLVQVAAGRGRAAAAPPPPYPLLDPALPLAATVPVGQKNAPEQPDLAARSAQPQRGAAGSGGGSAAAGGLTPLELEMHAELAASWGAHHKLPGLDSLTMAPNAPDVIRAAQARTAARREEAEAYLLRHLSAVPDSVGLHGAAFRLLRLAGRAPSSATPLDLLAAAAARCPLSALRDFNPFLSYGALRRLHSGLLVWLQLCVLEDRLGRLGRLAGAGEECTPQLLQELQVRREWDPAAHPLWLVFEAEGRLQIRPAQYTVARQLMGDPGAIAQLNMGEGKTRVILPMLALHWADGSRVVRLNFLSTLMHEAYAHLRTHLTASVLGRKVFTLPFQRDVRLTPRGVRAMLASVRQCGEERGLLLVAPEHRLSLQLKQVELWAAGPQREAERAALGALAGVPYRDILDESDELLHHRLQLIYACGSPLALPALPERVAAIQALLRIASRLAAAGGLDVPEGACVLEPIPGRPRSRPPPASGGPRRGSQHRGSPPGSFCGLRLLPGEALAAAAPGFHRQLALALVQDPPYKSEWLRAYPERELLLQCITDSSREAELILGPAAWRSLSSDQVDLLLALRGLLGCGVLPHCLQRRHLVEYGVARPSEQQASTSGACRRRTRMAVPFRAAHVPAERSEFAQPDVALVLTHLAYYYDGLSQPEFEAALDKLLSLGPNARRAFYAEWLDLSAPGIPAEDLAGIDDVAKVDKSNAQQMALMHAHMSHNMAVVNFWLSYCALPSETRQFPQRLAASAWHLADNARGEVVGFSGTNDNHRLLPLQVHLAQAADAGLRATNGKMLHVLLEHTLGQLHTLPAGGPKESPVWRTLLDAAVELGVHALMDCGALLAGASNRQAAQYMLGRLGGLCRGRFQGVCYFDEALRCWAVMEPNGRTLPRHSSPIAERHTFVIFDDARCRGADLQLQRDAVGLLTLGPGVCKDKVMQAAGRLRQLGRGQKLRLAATPDISDKVCRHSGLPAHGSALDGSGSGGASDSSGGGAPAGALHVLCWVMHNTVQATQGGVMAWAAQGLHFAATRGAPQRALQPEVLELSDFYGGSKAPRPVGDVVAGKAAAWRQHCVSGGGLDGDSRDLMDSIVALGEQHGEGHSVTAGLGGGAGDEECERELEEEEEEEQEVEREVPRVEPAFEQDWDYAAAWRAGSLAQLAAIVSGGMTRTSWQPVPLTVAVKWLTPDSLLEIGWPTTVACTPNFLAAIEGLDLDSAPSHHIASDDDSVAKAKGAQLNEYLRPVESVLLLPSGELLLVSEREADQLQTCLLPGAAHGSGAGAGAATAADKGLGAGGSTRCGPLLLSLCYARVAFANNSVAQLALGPSPSAQPLPEQLRAGELVAAQVFNGEATYSSAAQRQTLRRMTARRLEQVEALLDMRGKLETLAYSDLERAAAVEIDVVLDAV